MLKIEKLCKNYGKFPALKELSLEVPDGQLHGFVGPNGAGKTTTMRILATLMAPTSGAAWVDGTNVVREGQKARKLVGYMPDFFGVYDNLTCREYLDFYARCYRIGAEERKRMGSAAGTGAAAGKGKRICERAVQGHEAKTVPGAEPDP